jgi:hypothetical protein
MTQCSRCGQALGPLGDPQYMRAAAGELGPGT